MLVFNNYLLIVENVLEMLKNMLKKRIEKNSKLISRVKLVWATGFDQTWPGQTKLMLVPIQ